MRTLHAVTSRRRAALGLAACCGVGVLVSSVLGVTYDARHSSHAGFEHVRVCDTHAPVGFRRPRRTVVVVVDGLGHVEAEQMASMGRLATEGQCRTMDVGPLSVSRPVYAVLSTGLEQDRTGVRGNDDAAPLAAQSIWDVAHAAGMSVSVVSELTWWGELFPHAFDDELVAPRADDYFRMAPRADLQLIHPVYVDEAGHESGAASASYRAAVGRADSEIGEMLDSLDLSLDLVVVTADHGHSLRGGHGGTQERVAHVLTCYAGLGVRHLSERGSMRATTFAPALAVLLGVAFPEEMRAGGDDLDTIFAITDPAAFPPGYLAERRATIEHFRDENRAELRRRLPSCHGSWERFHDEAQALQLWRASLVFLCVALVMVAQARRHLRHDGVRGAAFGVVFVLGGYMGLLITQLVVRGSFDLSSVSTGNDFIAFTVLMALAWSALGVLVHTYARASVSALLADWSALSIVGTLLALAHTAAFGWRVGYPAPSAELQFFPYFATLSLASIQGVGLVVAAFVVLRRKKEPGPTASESSATR